MERQEQFTSPIREYLAQKMQTSFAFTELKEIPTFETPGAKYEVRVVGCYLTEEEAAKDRITLDKSRPLRVRFLGKTKPELLKPDLFLSSSWYEVHEINDGSLDDLVDNECVHQGNGIETADFLLKLDIEGKHFSYCGNNWFSEPDPFDGAAYKNRPLNADEKKYLDNIIKDKLQHHRR